MMRNITHLVVHCSATPEGRDIDISTIRGWHKANGWTDVGYHYVVKLDGSVQKGRVEAQIGSHVAGHNATTIGICYIGGCDKAMKPKDTRTEAQKIALRELLTELKKRYPKAKIQGHRDFPSVAKACPSFDAKGEYANIANSVSVV